MFIAKMKSGSLIWKHSSISISLQPIVAKTTFLLSQSKIKKQPLPPKIDSEEFLFLRTCPETSYKDHVCFIGQDKYFVLLL